MSSRGPRRVKAAGPASSASALLARGPPRGDSEFLIVGIGASAGGLDACRRFLDALPTLTGAAFILVQHLDPPMRA